MGTNSRTEAVSLKNRCYPRQEGKDKNSIRSKGAYQEAHPSSPVHPYGFLKEIIEPRDDKERQLQAILREGECTQNDLERIQKGACRYMQLLGRSFDTKTYSNPTEGLMDVITQLILACEHEISLSGEGGELSLYIVNRLPAFQCTLLFVEAYHVDKMNEHGKKMYISFLAYMMNTQGFELVTDTDTNSYLFHDYEYIGEDPETQEEFRKYSEGHIGEVFKEIKAMQERITDKEDVYAIFDAEGHDSDIPDNIAELMIRGIELFSTGSLIDYMFDEYTYQDMIEYLDDYDGEPPLPFSERMAISWRNDDYAMQYIGEMLNDIANNSLYGAADLALLIKIQENMQPEDIVEPTYPNDFEKWLDEFNYTLSQWEC